MLRTASQEVRAEELIENSHSGRNSSRSGQMIPVQDEVFMIFAEGTLYLWEIMNGSITAYRMTRGEAGRQSVPEKNRNKRRAFGHVSFCLRVRGMTSDVSSSDL